MATDGKLYKYYVEDGELKFMSTDNYKIIHDNEMRIKSYEIPAGELGLKCKSNKYWWHIDKITNKQNLFTFNSDIEYARRKFQAKLEEAQLNIETRSKIIDQITIK